MRRPTSLREHRAARLLPTRRVTPRKTKRAPASELRKRRIRRAQGLKAQGLTSPQIAKRLGVAPSTVRDYLHDPFRRRARARQRRLGVLGVTMPAGGTPIESVKSRWKSGGPHQGDGAAGAHVRGKQLRAIIGKRARGF